MRKVNCKLIVLTVFILASVSFGGTYSGGTGNSGSPYQIGNVSDWQELMITTSDWDKEFILIADINLQGVTLTPVGNSTPYFTGIFDGNGHIISNAVINQPGSNNIGLFGHVYGGQIHNLGVENVNIVGGGGVGGLVGSTWEGAITSCYATGAVSGASGVGGLAGDVATATAISNCYAIASVSSTGTLGGLVGQGGAISNCYAAGVVSNGSDYVGGLLGYRGGPEPVTPTASFWDVQISGQSTSAGGTGVATITMQDAETYLRVFWDFKGEVKNGINDTWAMPPGGGYPVLAWQLDASPVSNDEMSTATAVSTGLPLSGTSVGATGLDITQNGYADSADVWYYYDCTATGKYTVTVEPTDFDSTVGVFDAAQAEIVFNDDFFGGKSVVILRAEAGQRYYIRVSGHNGQTGDFTLTVEQGAIQAIQGDLNYDGDVNLVDFAIFANQWLED